MEHMHAILDYILIFGQNIQNINRKMHYKVIAQRNKYQMMMGCFNEMVEWRKWVKSWCHDDIAIPFSLRAGKYQGQPLPEPSCKEKIYWRKRGLKSSLIFEKYLGWVNKFRDLKYDKNEEGFGKKCGMRSQQ